MILIRKRPDGAFERIYPDGSRELFTLPPIDSEGVEEQGERVRYPLNILDGRPEGGSASRIARLDHP